jgi:hypothetical protein
MSILPLEAIESAVPDLLDAPLDAEVDISDSEYARIMRRAGVGDTGADTGVSAFSSSI